MVMRDIFEASNGSRWNFQAAWSHHMTGNLMAEQRLRSQSKLFPRLLFAEWELISTVNFVLPCRVFLSEQEPPLRLS